MSTIDGGPDVMPPEKAPTRKYQTEKIWISGVQCTVERPFTLQPDKTWKATPEDKKEYQFKLREARRWARNLPEPEEIAAIRKKCGPYSRRRFSEVLTVA